MFDNLVQKLVHASANDLMKVFDTNVKQIPKAFNLLKNQNFVFQLKIDKFNLQKGELSYSTTKIFVNNQSLQANSKIHQVLKYQKHKQIMEYVFYAQLHFLTTSYFSQADPVTIKQEKEYSHDNQNNDNS